MMTLCVTERDKARDSVPEGDVGVPNRFVWSSGRCQTTVRKRQPNCRSANALIRPNPERCIDMSVRGTRGGLDKDILIVLAAV
jgi:hypothetical protein